MLFQSLYCEYEDIFVFKYSSLITWHSFIDRNNTLLGSILYVENYLLGIRANSDRPAEIDTFAVCILSSSSLFCAVASPGLCPLPSSFFIKCLDLGRSSLGSVRGLPHLSTLQRLEQMANKWVHPNVLMTDNYIVFFLQSY